MKLFAVPIPDEVPFQYLDEVAREYDVTVDHNNDTITGTMESLANFFQALDGPAQSFPIDEFTEWASSYEVDENGIPV